MPCMVSSSLMTRAMTLANLPLGIGQRRPAVLTSPIAVNQGRRLHPTTTNPCGPKPSHEKNTGERGGRKPSDESSKAPSPPPRTVRQKGTSTIPADRSRPTKNDKQDRGSKNRPTKRDKHDRAPKTVRQKGTGPYLLRKSRPTKRDKDGRHRRRWASSLVIVRTLDRSCRRPLGVGSCLCLVPSTYAATSPPTCRPMNLYSRPAPAPVLRASALPSLYVVR